MIRATESPTRPLKILVVEDESLAGLAIRKQLAALGHQVLGQAANISEATAMFNELQPDVVLLDIRLSSARKNADGVEKAAADGAPNAGLDSADKENTDGIELATKLQEKRRCPMIIVSAFSDPELIERASAAGVFGYLTKPVSLGSLQGQIEIAVARFMEHERLRLEKDALAFNLETRKLTERAKGVLMRRLHLSEEDAHRRLQHESQKRRISLPDIARKILESEELLGGE